MPQTPSYPGVYVEETPSGVRTIVGVATSVTAFVGAAGRGPTDLPTPIASDADYVRRFGGLSRSSPMSYAVSQYFLNGGRDAIIVRVARGAAKAAVALHVGPGMTLVLEAKSAGAWGNRLTAEVEASSPAFPNAFDLKIREMSAGDPTTVVASEAFRNLTTTPGDRFVGAILAQESALVAVAGSVPAARPVDTAAPVPLAGGDDGDPVTDADIADLGLQAAKHGLYALDLADLFNLLVIPPLTLDGGDLGVATHAAALGYARSRRAIYLVDAPAAWSAAADPTGAAEAGLDALVPKLDNGAIFFPRLHAPDSLQENRLAAFAPTGAVAGVIARIDATRGVWKTPAGIEAALVGVPELAVKLTDTQNGRLNPLGINCLRSFPAVGIVVWGGRTLRGADAAADQWKYLAVRRTGYFIEETLFRATRWGVFEPNAEPLWSQIRLDVGAFMQNLFRQGAFQGRTPREAYMVKCDRETTTQADIDNSVFNVMVGFAPLKPAEFVIVRVQQRAGQIAT